MKIYIYDLEIYPNYFLAIFKNKDTKEIFFFEDEAIIDFLTEENILVGFNNVSFDDRILKFIKHTGSIKDVYKLCDMLINKGGLPEDFVKQESSIKIANFTIDLINYHKHKALKELGVSLGHDLIQELPINPNKNISLEEREIIKKYCLNDVEITEKLYHKNLSKIKVRQTLMNLTYEERKDYNRNFYNLSDAQLASTFMGLKYCFTEKINFKHFDVPRIPEYEKINIGEIINPIIKFKNNILINFYDRLVKQDLIFIEESINTYNKNQQVIKQTKTLDKKSISNEKIKINNTTYNFGLGGLHSDRSFEVFKSSETCEIIDVDVASYYPSISVNFKIKPDFLKDSWLLIYKNLIKDRLKAKNEGMKEIAEAYKIVLNSLFGKFNEKYFYAYDPKSLYAITLNGELCLLMLIERLEEQGFEVIYANTDGLTYKKQKNGDDELLKKWEKETGFVLEKTNYEHLIIENVNNYSIKTKEGKIKRKGSFSQEQEGALNAIIISKALEEFYFNNVSIEDTIKNSEAIEDFLYSKKISKRFNVEFENKACQYVNRYFISTEGGFLERVTCTKKVKILTEKVILANDLKKINNNLLCKYFYINKAKNRLKDYSDKTNQLTLF
jgi:hypothetical protein